MLDNRIITSESPHFSIDLVVPPRISFWVSWVHNLSYGNFSLRSPWWTTKLDGKCCDIYAALKAYNELEIKELISNCYTPALQSFELRFIKPQPKNWTPFRDHYQWKPWMEWEK